MRVWMKQTGLPLLATIAFVAISFAASYAAHRRGLLRVAEFELHDHFLARRATNDPAKSPCIIIGVTEQDIRNWGGKYPLTDRTMAQLLERVVACEPATIGVDIYRDFSIPERHATPEAEREDQRRLEAVVKNDQATIIMPHLLAAAPEYEVLPPTFFDKPLDPAQVGFVDVSPDQPDEVVRRALLNREDYHKQNCTSLPLLLAANYLSVQNPPIDLSSGSDANGREWIKAGNSTFRAFEANDGAYVHADAAGFQILMDYGGPLSFRTYSISQVLSPDFKPEPLHNSVVLIGATTDSVKDYFRTPLKSREYGVVVHARIADQIIRAATAGNAVVSVASQKTQIAALIALCIGGGVVGWQLRYWHFLTAIGVVVAALVALEATAVLHGIWVPTVRLMLGFLLSAGSVTVYMSYRERLDRLAMMRLFERSVSGDVAKVIWQRRDEIFEHGRLRTRETLATVLFTDLANFSSVAERLDARPLIDWLNEYFQKLSDLVCQFGGNINKFNGDQIVAVFGPPLDRTTEQAIADARGAVSCAVEMRSRLRELNADWRSRGMPQTNMRIGVHTGSLVAGSLGSRDRQEWTVIGDTVNIAARLESFNKSEMSDDISVNGCRIIISGSTHERLAPEKIDARSLGWHELTGRKQKIEVFGVINYADSKATPPTNLKQIIQTEEAKGSEQICNAP